MRIIKDPKKIESRSFEIIERRLKGLKLTLFEKEVVRRVAHATADLNLAKKLIFHPQAIKKGLTAIREGRDIIVDASMVGAGINKRILSGFGGKVICFMNDKEVMRESGELKITRAILAMRRSAGLMNAGIVAIGNAPTALFELCDLINSGKANPALVVGVPVGFVGAAESKKELRTMGVSFISNPGRRGGSSVAAAIINALLKIAERGK